MSTRRVFVCQGAYVALLLGPLDFATAAIGHAPAPRILAVRLWPSADYTRITIESDAPLKLQHALQASPLRLNVSIEGITLADELKELVARVHPDDPQVAQIHLLQQPGKAVQLQIDLKQDTTPQVFTLKPVAAYQHRSVLDLYPAKPPDPLDQLMAQLAREKKASPSNDALELWLESHQRESQPATATNKAPASTPSQSGHTSTGKPQAPTLPKHDDKISPKVDRLFIVALDPGHGGEDPGAIGPSGTMEKDITLNMARRIKALLDALPNVKAMLTRDDDYFVPLAARVAKARRVKADFFVSIHADAFIEPRARGASVFALSDKGATSAQAKWLANKENAADAIGGLNIKSRDGNVLRTLLDMSTTAQIRDSLKVGSRVLKAISGIQRLHKPHVEQAGFAVLKAPDIPSILIETAFISNPEEEQKLNDPAHQHKLATAIVEGIQRYIAANPAVQKGRVS